MQEYMNDLRACKPLKRKDAKRLYDLMHEAKDRFCKERCWKCKTCKKALPSYLSARDELIRSCLPWSLRVVTQIFQRHQAAGGSIPLADLVDEANLKLLTAIDEWNPKYALSTFVATCVRRWLYTFIRYNNHMVFLPVRTTEQLMAMQERGLFTEAEIRREFHIGPRRARELIGALALYSRSTSSGRRVENRRQVEEPDFNLKKMLKRLPEDEVRKIENWMYHKGRFPCRAIDKLGDEVALLRSRRRKRSKTRRPRSDRQLSSSRSERGMAPAQAS